MEKTKKERIWLKKLRYDSERTQEEMAEYLGIPKTTYASYEQGYRTPDVPNAKILGTKLKIDWTLFFEEEVVNTTTEKEAAK